MIKYYAVTVNGYWGKGDTLFEACKNASITKEFVKTRLYRVNLDLVEKLNINDLGGLGWFWKPDIFELCGKEINKLKDIQDCMDLGYFDVRRTSTSVILNEIQG